MSNPTLPSVLERAYDSAPHEVDLTRFIAVRDIPDDQMLAELIEADGRIRIATGKPVVLERYMAAVRNLAERPDPLDAAIDVVLRARSQSGHPSDTAVNELVEAYPEIEIAIRDAAQLSNMLVSTDGLQARLRMTRMRELPDDFGPELSDGRARYELRKLLGEGAFGQVYLTVDRHLSEPGHPAMVAIKILHERDDATPGQRERVIDEATTARRIDHPNVVRVMDRGVSAAGEDYIVYEYVDGGDLAIALNDRREPMGLRDAARLIARVARGVHAAHLAGLVHCDLKPGNIMLTSDGIPKVADFGIAARLDDPEATSPDAYDLSALPLGNLAFIAPEQFRKEPGAMTIPADVFSLGGILYLLITGQLPNGTSIEQIAETHHPQTGREVPPVASALRKGVGRDLELIVQRAMAPDPSDRHSSAAALADDLETWLRHEPLSWTRPSIWKQGRLWIRRRPALAVVAFLLVAALVAAQYFWIQSQYREREEAHRQMVVNQFLPPMKKVLSGDNRHPSEMLLGVWMLETIIGPQILGSEGQASLWDMRIEIFRKDLDRDLAAGRAGEFITLIRESQLAFWLVSNNQPAEASERLASNRAGWQALLPADDPWLQALGVLTVCAEAQTIMNNAPADLVAAQNAVDTLNAHLPFLRAMMFDSPIHHLTLRIVGDLYGKKILNDSKARKAALAELDSVVHQNKKKK